MKLYQETPCSIPEAGKIVDFFLRLYKYQPVKLLFRECTGCCYFDERKIELPCRPLPPWVKFDFSRYLRVGVVLHELAHLIDDTEGAADARHHSRSFVRCLDRVLVQYHNLYKGG